MPAFPAAPSRLIAVDKSRQTLHLIERRSPPVVVASFPCTTGLSEGDKLIEGDKKTPEGIYFIQHKLTSGLDQEMYGGIAYTLNYPNPVDRLRGKTGYGIWIHSKGREIVPMETQGCIALNLLDIDGLGPSLERGTAVAVAHRFLTNAQADGEAASRALAAEHAARLSEEWARAWASRSPDLFSFYDQGAYAQTERQAFSVFQAQKERLFKKLPWIHTAAMDVQTLSGPGYWVTWFKQYYRAPNLTTEGVRRLYWQEDAAGNLRIVGMEWHPTPLDLEERYMNEFVRPSVADFLQGWHNAWLAANLDVYMAAYSPGARQGSRRGAAAIHAQKAELWQVKTPTGLVFSEPEISWAAEGITVQMRQTYTDSSGYTDQGLKRLTLAPQGNGWQILKEDWSAGGL